MAVLPNNTLDSWSVCYLTISLGNSVAVLTEVLLGRVAGVMVLAKQIPWVGRVAVLTEYTIPQVQANNTLVGRGAD